MRYLKKFAVAILLISCNSNKTNEQHSGHNEHKTDTKYAMKFGFTPVEPAAPAEVQISLTPVEKGTDSIVSLEVQHEKKIHLIVVSEDLASFRHLHPVEQADGTFNITESFKVGGKYLLYADFKPLNNEKQVTQQYLNISGEPNPDVVYNKQSLQAVSNGFEVSLQIDTASIIAGKELMFTAQIEKNRRLLLADSLENYLGEKAHMVIIGISNKKYLHVHPMTRDEKLMLHTTFPEAGIYRAWLEFKKDGKVNVADFVIKVSLGNAEEKVVNPELHKH